MAKESMTAAQQKFQAAISGCSQISSTSSVNLDGKPWTSAQIVAELQAAVAAMNTVGTARAGLTSAVAAQKTALETANQLYLLLKQWVGMEWGRSSPQVANFGFPQKTAAVRSATSKALAAARAKQTRAVRGTVGKKQRQRITVAGASGLQLVSADGQPIPGAIQGPVAPAGKPAGASTSGAATPVAPAPQK